MAALSFPHHVEGIASESISISSANFEDEAGKIFSSFASPSMTALVDTILPLIHPEQLGRIGAQLLPQLVAAA
jgi:hypothetical protein